MLQVATDGSILGIRFEGTDLYFLDGSNARQPIARLSGGEKALVCLCIRLALAEQALKIAPTGKLQFLILDEVYRRNLDRTADKSVAVITLDIDNTASALKG